MPKLETAAANLEITEAHVAAARIEAECIVTGESYRNFSADILHRLSEIERKAAEGSVRCKTSASLLANAVEAAPPTAHSHDAKRETAVAVAAMLEALGEDWDTRTKTPPRTKMHLSAISPILPSASRTPPNGDEEHYSVISGRSAVSKWSALKIPAEASTVVNRERTLLADAASLLRTLKLGVFVENEISPPPSPDRRSTTIFQYSNYGEEIDERNTDEEIKNQASNEEHCLSTSPSEERKLNSIPQRTTPPVHEDVIEARALIAAAQQRFNLYNIATKKVTSKGSGEPATSLSLTAKKTALKELQLDSATRSSPHVKHVKDLYFRGGAEYSHLQQCVNAASHVTFSPRASSRASSMAATSDSSESLLDSEIEELMDSLALERPQTTTSHKKASANRTDKGAPNNEPEDDEVAYFKGFNIPSNRKGVPEVKERVVPGRSSAEAIAHKLNRLRPPKLDSINDGMSPRGSFAVASATEPQDRRLNTGAEAQKSPPSHHRVYPRGVVDTENERKMLLELEAESTRLEEERLARQRAAVTKAREEAAARVGLDKRLLQPFLDDDGFLFHDPFGKTEKSFGSTQTNAQFPLQVPTADFPLTMTWPQAASHPDRVLLLEEGIYQQASHATLIHHWKSRRIAIVGKRLYIFRHPSTKKELQMEIDEQVAQEAADNNSAYHHTVASVAGSSTSASVPHAHYSTTNPKVFNRSVLSVGVDRLQGEIAGGAYLGKQLVVIFRYTAPASGPEEAVRLPFEKQNDEAKFYHSTVSVASAAASAIALASQRKVSSSNLKKPSSVAKDGNSIVFAFPTQDSLKELISLLYVTSIRAKTLRDIAIKELINTDVGDKAKPPKIIQNQRVASHSRKHSPETEMARNQAASELNVNARLLEPYLDDDGAMLTKPTPSNPFAAITWQDAQVHPNRQLLVDTNVSLQAFNSNVVHHWKSRRIAIVGKRLYVFRHPSTKKELQMEIDERITLQTAKELGKVDFTPIAEKSFCWSEFSVGVDCLSGDLPNGVYRGKSLVAVFAYTPPIGSKAPPVRLSSPKRQQANEGNSVQIALSFGSESDLKNTIQTVVVTSSVVRALQIRAQNLRTKKDNESQVRRRGVSFASGPR